MIHPVARQSGDMRGTVTSGEGAAAEFVPPIADLVAEELGFRPYPGTFNLAGVGELGALPRRTVADESLGLDNCRGVRLRPCAVDGVRAAVVRPLVPDYPDHKCELLAPAALRSVFAVSDGDAVALSPPDERWAPDGVPVRAVELDAFDAAVFDLDGTLVDLRVDWAAVKADLADLLGEHVPGDVGADDVDLPAVARENGRYGEYAALLAEYELAGADAARRRPLLDVLDGLDCPVGVCTKNAEAAAERALSRFGVAGAVDALVARETTREQKPHPEPLERCLDDLGVAPGNAVFVGDDPTDCETAVGAGTSFLHPDRAVE